MSFTLKTLYKLILLTQQGEKLDDKNETIQQLHFN